MTFMLKSFPILSSKQNSGNFSTNSFIQFDPVKTMILCRNNLHSEPGRVKLPPPPPLQ